MMPGLSEFTRWYFHMIAPDCLTYFETTGAIGTIMWKPALNPRYHKSCKRFANAVN